MRLSTLKPYILLTIAVIVFLTAWTSESVYKRSGRLFHQRVFGFTMQMPENWQVKDQGEISTSGDYMISFGPNLNEEAKLYFCLFPVKGLSLMEFANETMFELELTNSITFTEEKYGDLDCLVSNQKLSVDSSEEFPSITTVFSRIGDNYMRVFFMCGDSGSRKEINDFLDTIKVADELREISFLNVANYAQYGSLNTIDATNEMLLYSNDPELMIDITSSDGSERMVFDDFAYPARFPEGEVADEYGYRAQYYQDGRYFVDNRKKLMDVYIPDIKMDIRNFHITLDMRFEGGHPVKGNGIVFRGSEKGFYLFDLSPDGFYALYQYKGGFVNLIDKTFFKTASSYEDNHIEIEVKDNTLILSLDGRQVERATVSDDLPSGFLGLYVCAGSWVSFDNYYVEIND
jgi:hypothetical protein